MRSPGLSLWNTDNTIEISSTFSHILVSENDEYNLGLSINGTPVNHVSTSKSLGVLIDADLTWGSHIEKLAKKNCLWYCRYQTVQAICSPSNIAYLIYKALAWFSRISTIAMFFGDVAAIKLADKLNKTPKSCSASSNFLKLRRRYIAAVPKSLNGF